MVAFYNTVGRIMYVHESRVQEYIAMGYKPVAVPVPEEKKATAKKSKKKEG